MTSQVSRLCRHVNYAFPRVCFKPSQSGPELVSHHVAGAAGGGKLLAEFVERGPVIVYNSDDVALRRAHRRQLPTARPAHGHRSMKRIASLSHGRAPKPRPPTNRRQATTRDRSMKRSDPRDSHGKASSQPGREQQQPRPRSCEVQSKARSSLPPEVLEARRR